MPIYSVLTKGKLLGLDGAMMVGALLAPFLAELLLKLPTDCYVQQLGYLCPACGGTRTVILLFRGDVMSAFRMNAYFFLTAALVCVVLILLHIAVFTEKHLFSGICEWLLQPRTAIVWAIGFVLFGILRNITHM